MQKKQDHTSLTVSRRQCPAVSQPPAAGTASAQWPWLAQVCLCFSAAQPQDSSASHSDAALQNCWKELSPSPSGPDNASHTSGRGKSATGMVPILSHCAQQLSSGSAAFLCWQKDPSALCRCHCDSTPASTSFTDANQQLAV
jgi:hypothetical protein